MEPTSAELDRILGYKILLDRIMTDPPLFLEFCKIEKMGLQVGYEALDERVRELDQRLRLYRKQEGVEK